MKAETTESVRIPKIVVDAVRELKVKTGIPIAVFFAKAASEKLKRIKSKKKL